MIIVSQDKNSIINFNRTQKIWIDDNVLDKTNTTFEICADGETLGEYATEERAKEVLKEIIEQYEHEKTCECDRSHLTTYVIGIEGYDFIYEMPRE